jgi:CBS domain-containing protein
MSTVAELGCEPALAFSPETPAKSALERMLDDGATAAFVVDDAGQLLGVVPDYELLKARFTANWPDMSIERILSHRVVCFTPDTPLAEAIKTFREGQHSRAAVVEAGRLVGQVTRTRLLQSLCREIRPAAPKPKFLRSELARNAITLRSAQW